MADEPQYLHMILSENFRISGHYIFLAFPGRLPAYIFRQNEESLIYFRTDDTKTLTCEAAGHPPPEYVVAGFEQSISASSMTVLAGRSNIFRQGTTGGNTR